MWHILLAIPLIAHGLAHLSGVILAVTNGYAGFDDRPWLFSLGVRLHSPLGRAFGLLWLVAALVLGAAGVGLLLGQAWWAMLALVGAVLSLAAILPWWKAVPSGAKVGAAFDLLVVLAAIQPAETLLPNVLR